MDPIKTILLTGASGYLGSNLARAFIAENFNVIILKRQNSDISRLNNIIDSLKVYDINSDVYSRVFEENTIDCVVHTAASYGRKGESLANIYQANLMFPASLLDSCIKHGVKYFLNTGTSLPAHLNDYALSKNQFSNILELHKEHVSSITVKLEYFYGAGDDNTKFISFVLDKLLTGMPNIDLSDGTQVRDFIYIKDVINAYLVLLRSMPGLNEKYKELSLGSGESYTLKDIVKKLKFFTGSKTRLNFGAFPMRKGDVMFSQADIQYMNQLGWKPDYDIDQGIKETINIEKTLRE